MADERKRMELFKEFAQLKKQVKDYEKEEKKDKFNVKMVVKRKGGEVEYSLVNYQKQRIIVILKILKGNDERFDDPIIVADTYGFKAARELKSSGEWLGNTLYYPLNDKGVNESSIKKKMIDLRYGFNGVQLDPIMLPPQHIAEAARHDDLNDLQGLESAESSARNDDLHDLKGVESAGASTRNGDLDDLEGLQCAGASLDVKNSQGRTDHN